MVDNLSRLRKIVRDRQYSIFKKNSVKVKNSRKLLVDMQTANLILQVYKRLNPKDRAKYKKIINRDIGFASSIAWKMI